MASVASGILRGGMERAVLAPSRLSQESMGRAFSLGCCFPMQTRGFAPVVGERAISTLHDDCIRHQGPKARLIPAWGEVAGIVAIGQGGLKARVIVTFETGSAARTHAAIADKEKQ